jgi:zinc protease
MNSTRVRTWSWLLPAVFAAAAACGSGPKRPVIIPGPVDVPPGDGHLTPPPAPASPLIPLRADMRKGVLANGLTYYVLPHAEPQDRVYLWLAVNAGAVQEDDDQRGLAHFVEHMGFNGTAKYPKSAIVDFVEKTGMEFGAHLNAYTSFDETVYQLQVPTDDPALVATGLDILHEWASAMSFDPAEVDKERGVVLEEWRLGLGPFERVFDKQFPLILPGTRAAERLPIGKPEILRTAKRDTLVRFYQDWYRPDLMAVIVVGDIDPAALEAQVQAQFADLQGPGAPRQRPSGGVPTVRTQTVSVVTDPEMPVTSIGFSSTMPHRSEVTEADFRRYIVESLFHSMLGERFDDLAAKPGAPIRSGYSSTGEFTRDVDVFSVDAQVADGKLQAAFELVARELRRIEVHGFGQAELDRAKARLLRGAKQGAIEDAKQDGRDLAAEASRNFLSGEFMCGAAAELAYFERLVPTVTLAEMGPLLASWGPADTRTITIAGPSTMTAPTEASVRAWLAAAASADVPAWGDAVGDKPLIATAPTPGTIAREGSVAEIGVTEWTLSNGARVIIKPTDFENDAVRVRAMSPGGSSLLADRDLPTALVADDVVGAMGFGEFSPRDLGKALSGRVASAYPWITESSEGVSARGAASDLEVVLQLVHLAFTSPRKDPEAFAVWQAGAAEDAREWQRLPEVAFSEEMARFTSGGNPRRMRLTEADIGKVDLDRALALYRERFANAGDFTFTIVGNVDLAALRPLVEKYVASLPSSGAKAERARDIGVRPLAGVKVHETKRGQEPKAQVSLQFEAPDKWTKEAAIDLDVMSEVLGIRLREVLREDMGGVYGVGAWGWLTRLPTQLRSFRIGFGCDPERVADLKKAVFTVIAELQTGGASDDNLTKVRETRRRNLQLNLRDNDHWARELASAYFYGDDPKTIDDLEPITARITSANVKAAAKRFLDVKRYVFGTMVPATAAAPAAAPAPAP